MSHKTLKLVIAVTILAVLGYVIGQFIYGVVTPDRCEALNEEQCRLDPDCAGEYPIVGAVSFRGCYSMSWFEKQRMEQLSEKNTQERLACEMIENATWVSQEQSNYADGAGFCKCTNGVDPYEFRSQGNCYTIEDICLQEGGEYYPKEEFRCTENTAEKERSYYSCPDVDPRTESPGTIAMYQALEQYDILVRMFLSDARDACVCPDGELWSPDFECG